MYKYVLFIHFTKIISENILITRFTSNREHTYSILTSNREHIKYNFYFTQGDY